MRVCTFMSTDIAARITIQVMSTPRGGRPRGKHQKTLEKERDAAEKKDPALKEARLASVSVLRAQFFGGTARASASTIPATVPATAPADESACAEAADEEHILESSEQPPSAPAEEEDRHVRIRDEERGPFKTKKIPQPTAERGEKCIH